MASFIAIIQLHIAVFSKVKKGFHLGDKSPKIPALFLKV